MRSSTAIRALAVLAAGAALVSCANETAVVADATPSPSAALQDRIARALAVASPPADPADAKARDAASERLAGSRVLLDAMGPLVLWGGFDERLGYDPAAYRLTALSPVVWAKLYLSTFTFPGEWKTSVEGRYTVLEVAARFRDRLDPGDYPYPFWHSSEKWKAYVGTGSLLLVFDSARLIAAYRKARQDHAAKAKDIPWDGRWRWTDGAGREQPRAALYEYLLSPGNPHATSLETAYRKLEQSFRRERCLSCHAPNNYADSDKLFLLNYPNQALAARHTLTAVLRGNKMPPRDPATGRPSGLDAAVRDELISLAKAFEDEADAALAYELRRR